MRKVILAGAAGAILLTLAVEPADAQYRPDRVGQACAGSFYEASEQRVQICSGMIEDPKRSDQSRAFAYANRAGAYYELRKLDLALADANRAVELWPEYQQGYVIRGTTLGDLGRSREALADLDKAVAMGGGYAAYLGRGHVRLSVGDFEKAQADFDEALKRAATASALMGRGIADNALGLYDQAEKDFSLAIHFAPQDPRLWVGRAEASFALGNREAAASDVQRAAKISKASTTPSETIAKIWLTVGDGLAQRGDYPNALSAFDGAVAEFPSASTYNARCWHRATAGRDLPTARADCDRALEMDPGNPGVLDSRGLVRLRGGDLSGAIEDLDAALQARPRSAGTLFVRGLAKKRLGPGTGGDADIMAALTVQPNIGQEYARYGLTP